MTRGQACTFDASWARPGIQTRIQSHLNPRDPINPRVDCSVQGTVQKVQGLKVTRDYLLVIGFEGL